ncbi:MAG: hypothetical protein NTZ58_00580 [Solirubrobacterales bacterium]|nr:hypothetical protein [Solirubrobacterales bacterium]
MFSDQINAAQVGVPGDACTTCGSALSPDQRYCLSCGTRRSGANLHFQQILAAEAAAQAPAVSTAQAAGGAGAGGATTRSSMPALASIACLLLALGVGVLIGKSGSGSGSAGTTQAVTAAPLATDAAAGAAAESTAAKKTAKSTTSDTPAASTASNPSLKKLENLSPEQYQKQSLKLPKTVGTGGAPPPVDNKAPAGGGSFDTIG